MPRTGLSGPAGGAADFERTPDLHVLPIFVDLTRYVISMKETELSESFKDDSLLRRSKTKPNSGQTRVNPSAKPSKNFS